MSIKLSEVSDPRLRQRLLEALQGATPLDIPPKPTDATAPRQTPARPILNKTERRCRDILLARGYSPILEQAITLRLDQPFTSYRPDLAYIHPRWGLVLVEVKGPHRFRETILCP